MTKDAYFTDEKIEQSVTNNNWEMVPAGNGKYKLRQRDKHYMTTVDFDATDETIRKFCVTPNSVNEHRAVCATQSEKWYVIFCQMVKPT